MVNSLRDESHARSPVREELQENQESRPQQGQNNQGQPILIQPETLEQVVIDVIAGMLRNETIQLATTNHMESGNDVRMVDESSKVVMLIQ